MVLTSNDAIIHIRHALGGDVADLSILRILNEAGRYMTAMHAWKYLNRPAVYLAGRAKITGTAASAAPNTLTLTGAFTNYTWVEGDTVRLTAGAGITPGVYRILSKTDSNTVVLDRSPGTSAGDVAFDTEYGLSACALPSDFARVLSLEPSDSVVGQFRWCGPVELLKMRTDSISVTAADYWGCLSSASPFTGGKPVRRLELWPAPLTNNDTLFTMFYRAKWTEVDADSDFISIPDYLETLYFNISRAIAQGYEEADVASVDQRLTEITGGPVFRAARMEDGYSQRSYGGLTGGHMSVGGDLPIFHNGTSLGGPS